MAYWLLKTEPGSFSIDDLASREFEPWDGVRNYQARNNLRAMKVGDECFFYHSVVQPSGIVGICEVIKEAYPDHTQFDHGSRYFDPKATPDKPRWFMPDVRFVRRFDRMVTLKEMRSVPGLEDMVLLNRGRLSVQPVTPDEWKIVCALAEE